MKKPIIFMFSGQGSHYYQMGQALYEENPVFRHWMREGDALCQDQIGLSVIKELYHPDHKKSDIFNRTLLTHPAIYMVEYALAKTILSVGITPDYVLGSSLGEFAAAVFAGVLSFEEGFKAVLTQAQMFEAHCSSGAMMAIMDSPGLYELHPFMREKSELAAINFPSHFVISGEPQHLAQISHSLKTEEITTQELPVTYAFHSSLIDRAAPSYLDFLKHQFFKLPNLSFISCTQQGILDTIPPSQLWQAVREPIYFQSTLEALEKESNFIYLDLGPSGTLATFAKYNLKDTSSQSQTYALLTPFSDDVKNLANLAAWLSS
ncbi:MAG: acyltransferase domain-containing protein [Alphaproteobacteria bacterium]|nr:acyltransferase domain-containing protein [Alphaproteobacteria bacterium]